MIKPISAATANTKTQQNKRQQEQKNKQYQMAKDGILVDNFVKDEKTKKTTISYTEISMPQKQNVSKTSSFNMTNAIAPLVAGTAAAFAGVTLLSAVLLKSSKALKNAKPFETLPDLATNMNIRQEQHFATYRMLRDPSTKNIAGALGVFIYSGLTIAAKNFVDGAKEIWVKKQQADIERDLQEDLIQVETDSFAGKINATNEILAKISKKLDAKINFAGKSKKTEKESNTKSDTKKLIALSAGVALGAILAGKITYSNIKKSLKNANDFTNDYTEKALKKIESIVKSKNPDTNALKELFSVVNAKPEYIKETLNKTNMPVDEITKIVDSVGKEQKSLFVNAPTSLGGIPEKIQYYCYIDEDRGHLYNWILHPENKFAKYIFLSFAAVTSVGYVGKQILDAIKEVAVSKENAKTELNLKKRLVEVEIENFKSKKNAAVEPLMENFEKQIKANKSKEELKTTSENILSEIKNGPPYIFG